MASVDEAREILEGLGMPSVQCNRMAGMTLIALCGLGPGDGWEAAQRRSCTITKGIMDYLRERYGARYAPNTRETFRRQVLHAFVQGGVAERNPFDPELPTNSPRSHYAVTEEAMIAIRQYGTDGWQAAVSLFRRKHGVVATRHAGERRRRMLPVAVAEGLTLRLSPGAHNSVQKAVVEEFVPRFAPGARLLYLGDTADKSLFVDRAGLAELGIAITEHDKQPDILFYDPRRKWLFLVEAVTSHGPVSPKRVVEMEAMLARCAAGAVYVSAFPNFREFRRHMSAIAWETEVWLCDNPDHLIHYDGDRFLGPRPRESGD